MSVDSEAPLRPRSWRTSADPSDAFSLGPFDFLAYNAVLLVILLLVILLLVLVSSDSCGLSKGKKDVESVKVFF